MKIKKFTLEKKIDFSKYLRIFEADTEEDPDALALGIKPTLSKEEIKDLILTVTDDLGADESKLSIRVYLFNSSNPNNIIEVTNKSSVNLAGPNLERVAKWLEDNKGLSLRYDISYGSGGYYDTVAMTAFYNREAPDYLRGFVKDTDSLANVFKNFSSLKKKFKVKNLDIDICISSNSVKFILIDPNIDSEHEFGIADDTKEIREFCDKINAEIFRNSSRYSNFKAGYTYTSKQIYVAYQGGRRVSVNFKTQMITWLANQLKSKMPEYSFVVTDLTTLTNATNGYDRWTMNSALRNSTEYTEVANGNTCSVGGSCILAKVTYGPPVAGKKAARKRAPRKVATKVANPPEQPEI